MDLLIQNHSHINNFLSPVLVEEAIRLKFLPTLTDQSAFNDDVQKLWLGSVCMIGWNGND